MNIEEINQLKMIGTKVRAIERMLFEELPKSVYGKEFCQVYNHLRTEVFEPNEIERVDEAGAIISKIPLLLLKNVYNLSYDEQVSVETLIGCIVTPHKVKDLKEPLQFSAKLAEEDEVYSIAIVTHYEKGLFLTKDEEDLSFVKTFNEYNEEREWLKDDILTPILSGRSCAEVLYQFFEREHSLEFLELPQLEGNVSLTLSDTGIEEVRLDTIGDSEDDMDAFFNFETSVVTIKREELDNLQKLIEKSNGIDFNILNDFQYLLERFMNTPFLSQEKLDYVKQNVIERISTKNSLDS